ncbi:hypothetical protein HD599_001419 [Conyzicola lurida]|uniref:Sap-like sulfolipid-1-addressing protein n=1 Tax=Conyzicola lurida TaxID=1172621 RepID=A0A841AN05_9MICO|nr:GAP family protein [Conyzicola lurida]MBB5843096.1 hypothetical protein [Conyzicola lurida]
MGPVIGEILPLSLGIAISPMPIMATIVMLLSPRAKATSLAFLIGWTCGIAITLTAFALLSTLMPRGGFSTPRVLTGVLEILVGTLMLVLAVRQWRHRPTAGEAVPIPRWLRAIDSLTPPRGLAIGFVYSAFRPKNLLITLAAGIVIGGSGLPVVPSSIAVAVFTAFAAAAIAAPIVAYFTGQPRITTKLEEVRDLLLRNVGTITSTALLFLGVVIIGMGIATL